VTARRQLHGQLEITTALDAHQSIEWVVVRSDTQDRNGELDLLLARCAKDGIAVRRASAREFDRLSSGREDELVIAAAAERSSVPMKEVFERGGAVWLVSGTAYPGNAGFVARTAEVSGATAVIVDSGFDRNERRDVVRAALRADRVFPILFESGLAAIEHARGAGFSVVAIEDVGESAPWQIELSGDVLFVVGGEKNGIPEDQLARCDGIIRIPMAGFIPSYNLQAAMAMVCGERLRQLAVAAAIELLKAPRS
jgi:tRNA G18 (ribose-2'-O)-methylase SpoU